MPRVQDLLLLSMRTLLLKENDKMKNVWQFIKFGLVGVSNTLISEAVYAVLVLFKCNYLFASFMGFVISVLNAYYWSNKYVFKEEEDKEKRIWWKVLLKTYVAYSWGFLINLFLLVIWMEVLHIADYMGPLQEFLTGFGLQGFESDVLGSLVAEGINLILTIPMNFLINKYWAYGQKSQSNMFCERKK